MRKAFLAIASVVVLTAGAIAFAVTRAGGRPPLVVSGGVPPAVAAAPVPSGHTPPPETGYEDWARATAATTGVPWRALLAYGTAHAAMAAEDPSCGLSWPTLAAIGSIESDHGRHGGSVLGADGKPVPPITGIPLDGRPGVRAIPDTDNGTLDGDRRWDRAVGPFQFIPTSWRRYASDADGDGRADPQDIDDAAMAAARHLCSGGTRMTDGTAWWRAILHYNASTAYAATVWETATRLSG